MKQNQVWAVIGDIVDVIYAGLLWLICSLPVFTVGASSSALYYAMVKCIRRERGKLTKSFFSAFASNFRQGTLFTLIYAAYILLWYFYCGFTAQMQGIIPGLLRFMIIPALIPLPWLFAYISRFENTFSACFKFTLYLSIKNIGATLMLLAVLLATGVIGWLIPHIIPLLPGVCCLCMSFFIEPVFKKITAGTESGGDQWYNE